MIKKGPIYLLKLYNLTMRDRHSPSMAKWSVCSGFIFSHSDGSRSGLTLHHMAANHIRFGCSAQSELSQDRLRIKNPFWFVRVSLTQSSLHTGCHQSNSNKGNRRAAADELSGFLHTHRGKHERHSLHHPPPYNIIYANNDWTQKRFPRDVKFRCVPHCLTTLISSIDWKRQKSIRQSFCHSTVDLSVVMLFTTHFHFHKAASPSEDSSG